MTSRANDGKEDAWSTSVNGRLARLVFAILWPVLALVPAHAAAQQPPDPSTTARMRVGPLALTPTISVSNFGIDTNVFNNFEDPRQDFTTTLSPQTQFWLRLGRGRLSGTTELNYVHYKTYATERALNTRNEARLELPFNRITPYVSETFINARERPGYEIDARARRLENTLMLGTDVRVGAKSFVGLALWRTKTRFGENEIFLGTSLSDVLNRTDDGVRLSLRRKLTPLTTFVIDAEAQRDRFELSPSRNSDSVRIMPGLNFDPFTIITGSARVGYRKYDALGPGAPGYKGLVASADLGYTLLGATRVSVHTERDLAYSYGVAEPYYLQTGISGTLTRKITSRWDVQLTGGRYQLDYQQAAAVGLGAGHPDEVRTIGGGIGYTLRPGRRLGVSLDKNRRSSDRQTREYNAMRIGASLSYGF